MKERGGWFRFYDGVLDNAKVQRIPDSLFRAWVNVLCLANRKGGAFSGDDADVAFALRVAPDAARRTLKALLDANLIEVADGRVTPHDWNLHQYLSDKSTERVQRFRKRRTKRFRNGDETPDETKKATAPKRKAKQLRKRARTDQNRPDSETETDSDSNSESEIQNSSLVGPRSRKRTRTADTEKTRGTRWPENAVVPSDWISDGAAARAKRKLPAIDLDFEAERFANFWSSASGQMSIKRNWRRTWLNWVTDESRQRQQRRSASGDVFGELADAFGQAEKQNR